MSIKQSIVIIGGGVLQVPVIKRAQEMGYRALVCDVNTQAPGMLIADVPIGVDINNASPIIEILKSLKRLNICGVLTVGTDRAITVASIAEELDLPGHSVIAAAKTTLKQHMRRCLKENGVSVPFFNIASFYPNRSVTDMCESVSNYFNNIENYPIVIKPVDNMGARGVSRLSHFKHKYAAVNHALENSREKIVLFEEYIEGPEFSLDAMISDGKVTCVGIADRVIPDNDYFIEFGHTMPSQARAAVQREVIDEMIKAIQALGLTHGFAKADIRYSKRGPVIIEMAARLSGGFMSTHTFPAATGIDLMELAIRLAVGEHPQHPTYDYNKIAIERAIIAKPGKIWHISHYGLNVAKETNQEIVDVIITAREGDIIQPPKSNVDKVGHIIASGSTVKAAEAAVEEARNYIDIKVKDV